MLQWMSFPFLYGVRDVSVLSEASTGLNLTDEIRLRMSDGNLAVCSCSCIFSARVCGTGALWSVLLKMREGGLGWWWIGDECSDLQLSWLCVCSYWPDWQFPWLCDLQFLWLDEFVWLYNGIQFERCGQETQIWPPVRPCHVNICVSSLTLPSCRSPNCNIWYETARTGGGEAVLSRDGNNS